MTNSYPKQYEIWLADLDPATGSEPGKIRPVIVLQSDILSKAGHNSVITCAISSQHKQGVSFIRISVEPSAQNGLLKTSYILCDQIRAIDINRLKVKLGTVNATVTDRVNETIKAILTL